MRPTRLRIDYFLTGRAWRGEWVAKVSPWHSIKHYVHHNNTNCTAGAHIEKENRRAGTGGKPLCRECAHLA